MYCRTHPSVNGVNTCNQCGEWLCDACTVEINGRIFCRSCLAQLAKGTEDVHPHTTPLAAGSYGSKRNISGGLLFVFSCIIPVPGVNYMYMGLIKRGLAAMVGFFMLIYLTSVFNTWPFNLIFGLSIPVYWLTCLFDGFNIRRRINSGEIVSDDVDDILDFIKRNKSLIITFVTLILALALASSLFSMLAYPLRRGLPVLVVLLGLYILFQRPKKHKDDSNK